MNLKELKKNISYIQEEMTLKIPKKYIENSINILPLSFLIKLTYNYKQDYVIFDSLSSAYSYQMCCNIPIGQFDSNRHPEPPGIPYNLLTHLHIEKLSINNKNFIAVINIDKLEIHEIMKTIKDFNTIKGKLTLIIVGSNLSNYRIFRNESNHTFFSKCDKKQLPKLFNVLLKTKYHKGKSLIFFEMNNPIEITYHPYTSIVQKWINNKIIYNKINIIPTNVNKINLGDINSVKRRILFSTEEEHRTSYNHSGNVIEFVFSNDEIPQIVTKFNGIYHYPASEQELKLLSKKANHFIGYHCIIIPLKLWKDSQIELYNNWRYIKKTDKDAILTCGSLINSISHWNKTIISCTTITSIDKDILKSLNKKIIVIDPTHNGTLINTLATKNYQKKIFYIHVPGKDIEIIRSKFELSEKEVEKRSSYAKR